MSNDDITMHLLSMALDMHHSGHVPAAGLQKWADDFAMSAYDHFDITESERDSLSRDVVVNIVLADGI